MKPSAYFRISGPSAQKVAPEHVESTYLTLRRRTFWGATVAYSLYYICRLALSVVKQPLIDDGLLTAGQLGLIGSAMLFVYAVGKFANGFIADYCNIRKFMSWGLLLSAFANLVLGALGIWQGRTGMSTSLMFILFAVLWGVNGWVQSMGAPPGVISLSRWFPLSKRGTWYSIFSATPYLGKSLGMIMIGFVTGAIGWQWGFIFSAVAGLIGAAAAAIFISDTPESRGLPSVQELSGETVSNVDSLPVSEAQKKAFKQPGIWVIAISAAFVYIIQYAITGWGVLFLQKAKDFSLASAAQIIAYSTFFGVLGTVGAGWLSDKVFKGNRFKPALLSGLAGTASLAAFLFTGGGAVLNTLWIALFSLSIGMLHCIVSGLMALDIVPRQATGAALGIVGIVSYCAAGIQDIVSGFLIQGNATDGSYDFRTTAIFWMVACVLSFVLPLIGWQRLKPTSTNKTNLS